MEGISTVVSALDSHEEIPSLNPAAGPWDFQFPGNFLPWADSVLKKAPSMFEDRWVCYIWYVLQVLQDWSKENSWFWILIW